MMLATVAALAEPHARIPLGDLCDLRNGRAFKESEWEDSGLPIIRIQNLNDPKKPFNYFSGALPNHFRVRTGDVLLSWSGTPGTSFGCFRWEGQEGWLNQHIFNVKVDQSRITPEYFVYHMNAVLDEMIGKAHGGVGLRHITKSQLSGIRLSVPSLEHQHRIVDMLSRADNIVRMRREAEQKVKEFRPALFLEMFGDPATNPMGWNRKALGECVSSIDSGKSPKCIDRRRTPGEWAVLKLGAVTWGDYDEAAHKVLPPGEDVFSASEVRAGDVLLSRKNTYDLVGAAAYVWASEGKTLLPDLIFRLAIANPVVVDGIYLWALLATSSKKAQLRSLASGAAESMPNISKARLSRLPVELPPIELQQVFAARVRAVRQIELQQAVASLAAADTFQSMLASAFGSSAPIPEALR